MSVRYPALRPYARGDVVATTAEESVALDQRVIEELGVPQPVLMENAGRSAALVLDKLFPTGRIVGVIGAGNNGGDALVLLRTLQAWGRDVYGVLVAERTIEEPLLYEWSVPLTLDADLDEEGWAKLMGSAEVLVDGVLGTGADGAPRERQMRAIELINGTNCPVVAIDVPSGIDPTTGSVPGIAVRADITIGFGTAKVGCLLHPARSFVGRLVTVEIAFPPSRKGDSGALVVTPAWAHALAPQRSGDTHKKAVGSVSVVAGQVGMAGAALLAGAAAFRSGAGLVRICTAPENRLIVQSEIPEAIWVDASDPTALGDALEQSDAAAVGPGLGTDAAALGVLECIAHGPAIPAILDADALNIAAAGAFDLAEFAAGRPVLITPHRGEISRLLPEAEKGDAPTTARVTAALFGCAVLLKGAPSVVAGLDCALLIDSQASTDLAVAGMGDALTGACATFLAQGLSPQEAGALGLFFTGRAARIAGRGAGLVPSDVIRWLPEALFEPAMAISELDLPFVIFDADPPS